jgi:hypothetical protein
MTINTTRTTRELTDRNEMPMLATGRYIRSLPITGEQLL